MARTRCRRCSGGTSNAQALWPADTCTATPAESLTDLAAAKPEEDVAMCRHTHPIPTCVCGCNSCCSCNPCCDCTPCWGQSGDSQAQLLQALALQNQLTTELLGAVNALTCSLLGKL